MPKPDRPDNVINMQRNERGQFLPRNEGDASIEVVLAGAKAKREQAAAAVDDGKKKEDDKKTAKTGATDKPGTFEIDETAAQFFDDMFPGQSADKDKDKDKAAEAEKEKKAKESEKAKKLEDEKAKKKATPPAKVAPRREAPQPMSAEQIAQLAAETAARVTGVKKEDKAKEEESTLPPNEQRKVSTLKHMETMFPEKYKDAVKRYQSAQTKLKDYAAKWEKDHPGETFDEQAEEHEDFFGNNDLYEFWEADDFDDARLDMLAAKRAEKKDEEKNREINTKLERLERSEKLREKLPEIKDTQIKAATLIWKNFGDEYAEVMGDAGWNKEKAEEFKKADPVGFSHRMATAQDLDLEAAEIYKLYNGLIDYDAKNLIHHNVSDFYIRFEQAMLKAPEENRTDPEGRTFMASKEYYALPKEKRDPYWTFTAEDVIFKRAQTLAKQVEKTIKDDEDRLSKFAELKGWKKAEANGDRKDPAKEAGEEQEEDADGKPVGPSGGSETKMAAIKIAADKDSGNSKKTFFDNF